jgi:LPPG:FO 2-phospho-L-lactate transferase
MNTKSPRPAAVNVPTAVPTFPRVAALAGGVGGAKLAYGLAKLLPAPNLSIIVNVGDDFEHLGLYISPDLDTVMYTLAEVVNPITGWGLRNETWSAMNMFVRYAAPTWFRLGDSDLATHIIRSNWLRQGFPLTWATRELSRLLGVSPAILPASDDSLQTIVHTDIGPLPFQEWFVEHQWQPKVKSIEFRGVETADPSAEVVAALRNADVIIFCPSNPYVSLDPILALPSVRRIISASHAKKVGVTPIVGGKAIKGPAAKMMTEMDLEVSPTTVARHFADLLDGFVLDIQDADQQEAIAQGVGIAAVTENTVMETPDDRVTLANLVLEFVSRLP